VCVVRVTCVLFYSIIGLEARNSSALGILRDTVPTSRKITSRVGAWLRLLGLTVMDDNVITITRKRV